MNLIDPLKNLMVGSGATWVLWLMLGLSVVSLAVIFERTWFFFSIRDDLETLLRDLEQLLGNGDRTGAAKRLATSPSAEAVIVLAGLTASERGVDAADEAMTGARILQRLRLERRLSFLGTLGNNAPFLGLLGTVIGIVGAFEELGKAANLPAAGAASNNLAPAAVMSNIAEALVATAVGLLVAIPAVAAFNAFQHRVRSTCAHAEALGHVLLAHLKADAHNLKKPPAHLTAPEEG